MTDLSKLAYLIYELMGLNRIEEQILKAIEDELVSSYSPIEMEGEDMSIHSKFLLDNDAKGLNTIFPSLIKSSPP